MMAVDTATLVRVAPWLTSGIFLWSLLSGLLGDVHLPTLHRSDPIALGSASQDSGYVGLWEQAGLQHDSNPILDTKHSTLPHEGRLLQLLPASASAGADWTNLTQTQHSQSSMMGASNNTAAQNESQLLHMHSSPASDQQQHQGMAANATSNAANDDDGGGISSANMRDRQAIGYTDSADILGLVGSHSNAHSLNRSMSETSSAQSSQALSAASNHTDAPPTDVRGNAVSHPNSTVSSAAITHSFNSPNYVTCAPHMDLPTPGMDIAPANQSKCYLHPLEYKNSNYLNDSYYMLYHHDLPTADPHPAFTWGDISRFSHVMHKMKRSDPMKAIFVGGSVSSSYCKNPSVTCWVKPVSDWLLQQNPNVKIINNAVGGTTSRTTAECFDAMVGKDADLIFLEYSYNDRFGVGPAEQQQGYELLVRKLLKLPHKPAVLIVHWWGPKHDCNNFVSRAEADLRAQGHAENKCAMTLWNSTEDRIQTIVQHYGVQSVSFRNAYWAEIDAEVDGYLPEQTLMPDLIHPSMHGVKLLGGLVTKFLTDVGVHMARFGHGTHTPSRLPTPLYIDESLDEQSNTCTRGDALQDMKVHTVDWYWVDGKKPGFQTDVPGASLVLMVTLPTDSSVSKLSLGYLASYEGMGWAQVECLGACTCPVLQIDANSTARASQEHFATVEIGRQNEGSGCLLKVATLYRSSALNDGHKFKVSSVAWTHDGTASEEDVAQAASQHSSARTDAEVKHAVAEPDRVLTLGDI